jgi:hypothetical protein
LPWHAAHAARRCSSVSVNVVGVAAAHASVDAHDNTIAPNTLESLRRRVIGRRPSRNTAGNEAWQRRFYIGILDGVSIRVRDTWA